MECVSFSGAPVSLVSEYVRRLSATCGLKVDTGSVATDVWPCAVLVAYVGFWGSAPAPGSLRGLIVRRVTQIITWTDARI